MQGTTTERTRWALETLLQAMNRNDGSILSREPKIRVYMRQLTGLVEKAARPEDYPECEYPDDYVYEHPQDSDLWQQLFTLAALKSDDFATCLCFVRANGAILVKDETYGWAIRPVIGEHGYENREIYDTVVKGLSPWKEELMALLKGLKSDTNYVEQDLFT